VLIIVILTAVLVCCPKVFFDIFGNSSPSAYHFESQVVHWTRLWTVTTYGFVFAKRIVRECVLATVLTVSTRKLQLQRQVLQRDISDFQELLFAGWATFDCRSAGVTDVVATQTEGDRRHHVLLAGRTFQLCQDAFTDIRHRSLHANCNKTVVDTLRRSRHLPEKKHFDQYHPSVLLPHSYKTHFLSPILTTDFLRSLPSKASLSTLNRPFPCPLLRLALAILEPKVILYNYPQNLIPCLSRRPL